MRFVPLLLALILAACSRQRGDAVRFRLDRDAAVSLVVSGDDGPRVLLDRGKLSAGEHRLALRGGQCYLDDMALATLPPGSWSYRAWAQEALALSTPKDALTWGADDGVPVAMAADDASVYIGWSANVDGAAVIACDPRGTLRWSHRRDAACGVRGLGVDAGEVFVLGHARDSTEPGSMVWKLNRQTGQALPWAGRGEDALKISSLWPDDAEVKPRAADAMAVGNGRVYLTFTRLGFIAVLDARDGHYVTTLTAPEPGAMALSTTPIVQAQPGAQQEVADFGVAVLWGRAVTYFVMPHEPPWVAANVTHALDGDERIAALTMRDDSLRTRDVQLYLGLAEPHSQVQVRPASAPGAHTLAIGKAGGRAALGPWEAGALRDIRALAIDSAEQLWVAEGGAWPRRVSVWTTAGRQAELVREFFGAPDRAAPGSAVWPGDPAVLVAQGCEWRIDPAGGRAECMGVITTDGMESAGFFTADGRTFLAVHGGWRDGRATVSCYERRAPGDWRVLSRLTVPRESMIPMYWADTDGDGIAQPGEMRQVGFAAGEGTLPRFALADGTLCAPLARYRHSGWTPSGAPLFDWEHASPEAPPAGAFGAVEIPGAGRVWTVQRGGNVELRTEEDLLLFTAPLTAATGATRTADGRIFLSTAAHTAHEITGASTLRALGSGTWKVEAR